MQSNVSQESVSEGNTNIDRRSFLYRLMIIIVWTVTAILFGRSLGVDSVSSRMDKLEKICIKGEDDESD